MSSLIYRHSDGRRHHRGKGQALPPLAWAWIAAGHLLAAGVSMAAVAVEDYTIWEWARSGLLGLCAFVHVGLTLEAEERRRGAAAAGGRQHVDQTSLWTFVGALVLPIPAALVLLVLVRAAVFLIARRPAVNFLFSSASIAVSMLAAHTLAVLTPLRDHLTGRQPWPVGGGLAVAIAVLGGAALAYYLVQAILVGVVVGLATKDWSPARVLGDRGTNRLALGTLLGACLVAVTQSITPWLIVLAVPIAVASTRDKQRLQLTEAEREGFRHDALHDGLTRLPVRRGFDPLGMLALDVDRDRGASTALLIIDIDRFKVFNERVGHLGGDRVLVGIADVLRSVTRHGDLVCRRGGSGGDETMVLLPGADRDEAASVAERIRAEVERARIEVSSPAGGHTLVLGADVPGPTVSIGVALAPCHGSTIGELEHYADKLLRQAKLSGRNQVVLDAVLDTKERHTEAQVARA
ncbi:GGDEF domain-containing protein [Saccharopolyspora elongata]|uniref:GGDEF domain-containing protein n=1 Tax=Saccharopolyspora elongata TaxID=2530387 RepID=UPI0014045DB2|nr:GGDEF domain-containing protein [Saccharopolyspora elongata]